ncbi:PAS domain-containing sensor histidine kinase [Mongoliimonas terrestris]|uniref:PAS domain-containing sensor histidine kinase n=1 Tax=Mongoliimonas terrestris TaxID=1709001 RepID=UPI000949577E|nr:PAS domain-containing sensor histidine kinase [Mongoliimonas terrestris]
MEQSIISTMERDAILAAVLRASLDCVIVIDEHGHILEFNDAAEDVFGWPRDQVIGRQMGDLIVPPRLREAHRAGMARYLHEGNSRLLGRRIEIFAQRADGTEFPVELAITETRVSGRRLFAASMRDLTERRAAEAALRNSEQRLAGFMENAPIGMYLKDGEGRFVMANPEMAHVFGRPVDDLIGRRSEEMLGPEEGAMIRANDDLVRSTRRALSIEEHLPGLDRYAWTLVVRFPIEIAPGEPVYIGGFDIDITSIKRAEAAVAEARAAVHQNEKLTALGLLLAGVAHELNNPLAILVGQSTLLSEDVEGTPLADRAAKIGRAAERCARIVKTFLSIARQKPPSRTVVDLQQTVTQVVELLGYALRTAEIEVVVNGARSPALVDGDPDQLHQVLVNLLVNAQQALATQPQPRRIEIGFDRRDGMVLVTIADNGPGIPPEVRARIFEPFFTTKAAGQGTGIGLSYSFGTIAAHGGKLELLPGSDGAVFRIALPAASGDRAVRAPDAAKAPAPHLGGHRVLVVDDEADVAGTIVGILGRLSADVHHVRSAEAAFEALKARAFDAVVCGLRLPGMDGATFLETLKAHHPAMADRIGFITGDTLGPMTLAFLASSGRPVLTKPFSREQLADVVGRLVAAGT